MVFLDVCVFVHALVICVHVHLRAHKCVCVCMHVLISMFEREGGYLHVKCMCIFICT